ncbi:MAG: hypothetical protein GZ088_09380 [Acidipila sp.]|nr:hypothetical protein [Acidipila sp.]
MGVMSLSHAVLTPAQIAANRRNWIDYKNRDNHERQVRENIHAKQQRRALLLLPTCAI